MLELREITRRLPTCERSVMISSVRPSLKYSLSGSGLRFSNGRTTIDFSSVSGCTAGRAPEGRIAIERYLVEASQALMPQLDATHSVPKRDQIWIFFLALKCSFLLARMNEAAGAAEENRISDPSDSRSLEEFCQHCRVFGLPLQMRRASHLRYP